MFDPPVLLDDPDAHRSERPPGVRAARPRDAATLVLVRRDGPAPRVLMGRRHGGHDFMPDKWVFPGGRVDRADRHAPHASDLRHEVAHRLQMGATASRARALGLAAIRETFEEAGLLLAKPAQPRDAAGPWREFLGLGFLPDLAALDFIARAITPPYRRKRFDARFFMADAARLVSLERRPDCGELDEIAWFEIDKALKLDLPTITDFVLKELRLRLHEPDRPPHFTRMVRGRRVLSHLA